MSGEIKLADLIEELQRIKQAYGPDLPVFVGAGPLHSHVREIETRPRPDGWDHGVWLR